MTSPPVPGSTCVVPCEVYPQYTCTELGGAGWLVCAVSSTRYTTLVAFLHARTRDGRPYEDERLDWMALRLAP